MNKKKILIASLVFPILALLTMTGFRQYNLSTGRDFTLPIEGYDPRDLLSGHYLTYTVNFGIPACAKMENTKTVFICLDPKAKTFIKPAACKWYVQGTCDYGRFTAGIEKFYIPESNSRTLDKQVRDKKASIVITVTPSGTAMVKDLLIDGKSWKN